MSDSPRQQSPRRRGPRGAAEGDTREALLEAARAEFAERGYRAATLRSIGARAGVDPSMISHYFGSKSGLFTEVTALAVDPVRLMSAALDGATRGPGAELGERLALRFLTMWEEPAFRDPALAVFRSALADPAQARVFREYLEDNLLPLISSHCRGPAPRRSATLAMSHLLGIVLARHVIAIGELRTATPAELAAAVGPVLQNYLDGRVGPCQVGQP